MWLASKEPWICRDLAQNVMLTPDEEARPTNRFLEVFLHESTWGRPPPPLINQGFKTLGSTVFSLERDANMLKLGNSPDLVELFGPFSVLPSISEQQYGTCFAGPFCISYPGVGRYHTPQTSQTCPSPVREDLSWIPLDG